MPVSPPYPSIHERALARIGSTVQQKYHINWLIGTGGMAAVYAATHHNGHRVAIKFLLDHLISDPDISRLFGREAYVANEVGHPGAVPVLDNDVDEQGCPFLIMPLLEGETLRARWERAKKRLAPAEVGVLTLDVLDVLACAHDKGIVHRDIKHDNLFLTTKAEVRVLDFGIARRDDGSGITTIAGRLVGTPAFMPPEQASGDRDAIGPHSDCWAVGATMFTLLSGEFVHRAEGTSALLAAAATRHARSLAEVRGDLPPSMIEYVDKALAFDPASRWQSAGEMRDALSLVLEGMSAEPMATVTARVRTAVIAELAPRVHETSREDTQLPKRRERDIRDSKRSIWSLTGAKLETLRRHVPSSHALFVWLAAAAASVVPFVLRPGSHLEGSKVSVSAPSAASTVSPESSPMPVVALRLSPACNRDADAPFHEGLVAMHEATWELAIPAFEKAVTADPSCPEAQLQLLIAGYFGSGISKTREVFRHARSRRDALGERDREMLDAFTPLVIAEPADREEARRRFLVAMEHYPQDVQMLTVGSLACSFAAHDALSVEQCLDFARRATELDPRDADGWQLQADTLVRLGRMGEAMEALNKCFEIAPGAGDCFDERTRILRLRGECAAAAATARRWIANVPTSTLAYSHMANALASDDAPAETVEAVLEQYRNNLPASGQVTYTLARARLAVLHGDFIGAEKLVEQLSSLLQESANSYNHMRASSLLIDLLLETGKSDRAATMVEQLLRRSGAWTEAFWSATYYEPILLAILLQQKTITEERWRILVEAWEKKSEATVGRTWGLRWGPLDATREVAVAAWRSRPPPGPAAGWLDKPIALRTVSDIFEGRAALAAGEPAEAIALLEPSAKSCNSLDEPFITTRAHLWLGQAAEEIGDTARACAAYDEVLRRWGAAKPRSITADEAKRRRRTLGCKG